MEVEPSGVTDDPRGRPVP